MNGRKSSKPAPLKINPKLTIVLFGDNDENNIKFVKAFGADCDMTEKNELFEFKKIIDNVQYPIEIHVISKVDERMIEIVQKSHCAFILFDMTERDSFDNLLDKWLIWLRDTCLYKREIFLLGDYQCDSENDTQEVFLVTSDDEIQEVIICADLNVKFINIGGLTKVNKYKDIYPLIPHISTVKDTKVEEENQGGSLSKKDCVIF